MVRENRRKILKGIAGTGVAATFGSAVASAGEDHDGEDDDEVTAQQTSTTLEWGGQGSENAELECDDYAYWHWILTPGGNVQIQSATLYVEYEDDDTDGDTAVHAYFPGQIGRGAAHFDVFANADGDTVEIEDAYVEYTYTGEITGNAVLTISHSNCVEGPPQQPPNGNGDGPDKKKCKKYHAKKLAFHKRRYKYLKKRLKRQKGKIKYHKRMHKKGKCDPHDDVHNNT